MLAVEADIFSDGHDVIAGAVLVRPRGGTWRETPMRPLGNDRWRAEVTLPEVGLHSYTVIAWRDLFSTWRGEVLEEAQRGPSGHTRARGGTSSPRSWGPSEAMSTKLPRRNGSSSTSEGFEQEAERLDLLLSNDVAELMARAGSRASLTRYERSLKSGLTARPLLSAPGTSCSPGRSRATENAMARLTM